MNRIPPIESPLIYISDACYLRMNECRFEQYQYKWHEIYKHFIELDISSCGDKVSYIDLTQDRAFITGIDKQGKDYTGIPEWIVTNDFPSHEKIEKEEENTEVIRRIELP